MSGFTFDKPSVRRISQSVLITESTPEGQRIERRQGRSSYNIPISGYLDAEVPPLQSSSIKLAKGPPGSEVLEPSNPAPITAWNPHCRLFIGSWVLLEWCALYKGDSEDVGGAYYITQHNSATRIRGKSVAQISPGTSGNLDEVVPIDGIFQPVTASAWLLTENVTIQTDMVTWAERNRSLDRWEIYQADCTSA